MPRRSLTLVVLFTISFMGFVGYSYLTRPEGVSKADSPAIAATSLVTQPAEISQEPSTDSSAAASKAITTDMVDKWIAEATGDDPTLRAAAIAALAKAPRQQALPVLKMVLRSGEPVVDRPLALGSLRTLALQQGDADSGIRDALRQAIYHGDNEATTQGAQVALDEVEGYLNQGA